MAYISMEERGRNLNGEKRLGKYRIVRALGQGGEGSVYLAEDENLGRYVAVKRLWEQEGESGERIREEAAFLRDLRHPMLPVVYELFYEKEWYLVMEYVDGISLRNYIEKQGNVGERQARLWASALLDVLDYQQTRETAGMYRDLKPDNIVVCRDGTLKLVDFGAAGIRSFGEEGKRQMAFSAGFAAPEQRGAGGQGIRADERSDLYAFGKTLCYMVTGVAPDSLPGTPLPASYYNPLLSEELVAIIRRCTEEEPESRYQVAGEIMRDLSIKGSRGKGKRRWDFVRHVEKQICLTDSFMA